MNPENLFKKSQEVILDEKKKSAIRQELLTLMKNNPLPLRQSWFATFVATNAMMLKNSRVALASIMVCVFLGGAIVVKADASLPGEWLYPIKTGVNEKVMEAMAFSAKDKMNVSIRLMDRRLQEAEILVVENTSKVAAEPDMASTFNLQAAKVLKGIERLKQEKKYDDAIQFGAKLETSLKAHDKVLEKLENRQTKKNLAPLLKNIKEKVKDNLLIQETIQKDIKMEHDARVKLRGEDGGNSGDGDIIKQ